MKLLKYLALMALCMLLCAAFCSCENENNISSPASSQAESSSQPEFTPEPESSQFTPAEDLIPSGEGEGLDDEFSAAFSQNPIDKQYDEDYRLASSFSMMQQACDTAARSWKNMIDTAYDAALAAVPEEEQAAIKESQQDWDANLDGEVEKIRSAAEETGTNEASLSAAKEIVLLYRRRAMELCKIKFEADGTLPAFPESSDVSAVG